MRLLVQRSDKSCVSVDEKIVGQIDFGLVVLVGFTHTDTIEDINKEIINLILEELNLEGAFIQDIIQPGYDTIAFYTYKNGTAKTVLVCTAQNSVRMNETRKKITKNNKNPNTTNIFSGPLKLFL